MINPLLTSFLLPPFTSIRPEHVLPAIKSVITNCRNAVEKIVSQPEPFTWENLCRPLADINNNLNKIWSPVNHLNSVKNNQELREVYEKSLPLISEYNTWIGQHKNLYQAYKNLRDGPHYMELSTAQKKSIDNVLRDFELSGINLSTKKQQRYSQIVARLLCLYSTYSNNVLDATMGWSKLITNKKELVGVPKNILNITNINAKIRNQDGWLLTLDISNYLPILTYCDNADLREELYYAYNTRASDQGPNARKWDNGPIMSEILALRYELAQLLGFENYADKSITTKMAQSTQQVFNFLINLSNCVRTQGEKEILNLRSFAKNYFNCNILKPWDIAYYSEKQKLHLFSINDEQLRPYFPEYKVINGLFKVVKRIYGIIIKERNDVDVWHPDVRFFDLFEENGNLCGSFYLDLYTRDNKRSGAWMDDCISMMRKKDDEIQKPVAYLICNINRPIDNKPALLNHSEVITLFHEFGHVLHHVLTRIDTPGVSGINGIPWDVVELPSQFMENYCWHSESLAFISGHYETGKPIPNKILNNLLETKNYQSALFILRQIEFSLFDFRIHHQYQPDQGARLLEILAEVKKQISVLPTVAWGRFPNTFNHIFSGGYAAGYYGYLWADVLASDIWSRFEKEGIFNRNTGRSFLDNILSRGGSEDPIKLFMRFRGRKPKINAMLRHYGIEGENLEYSFF